MTGTVAVCTNGSPFLARCLASLDTQIFGPSSVEVLVIDNEPCDATTDFLRVWQRRGGGRRILAEWGLTAAQARDVALRSSDEDVVLFVGADSLAPPGWTRSHLDIYDAHPDVGMAGGPVGLEWPEGRPGWVDASSIALFGAFDLGDETAVFPRDRAPAATNLSVRRRAAVAVGGFNLPPRASGPASWAPEEANLAGRLGRAGWTTLYSGGAGLVRQVPHEGSARRWLVRSGWAKGVDAARFEVFADRASQWRVLRRGVDEFHESAKELGRRRQVTSGAHDSSAVVRFAAHAGSGAEFLRLSLRSRSCHQ